MALSPADFYAYSRATGIPVPEDPYEKAELAPQVLEFRRNQLKAPQHLWATVCSLQGRHRDNNTKKQEFLPGLSPGCHIHRQLLAARRRGQICYEDWMRWACADAREGWARAAWTLGCRWRVHIAVR